MQMPEHACSFTGGMNKDLSVNNYPNTCFFDAKNFRVIVDESSGVTSSSLVSPKGNTTSFTLPADTVLLGYTVLREVLVLLTHSSAIADIASPDKIYRIPLSQLRTAGNIIINDMFYWADPTTRYLVYRANLGFNLSNPIRVIGNYENEDIRKIYWVDGLNTLKHLNIVYNDVYNKLDSLNQELLEIIPSHTYGTYELTETSGGHVKAGRIQYSYQLYSFSGTETMFAPASAMYNLTIHTTSENLNFLGSEIETEVNKAIKVTISLPTGTTDVFDRIRLLALEYETYGDVPTVRIVAEQPLTSNTPVLTDFGNSIGTLVLEEFQAVKNDLIPTTLESKNNYLFAGNITQEYFDIDELVKELKTDDTAFFDTRAYRWRYITAGDATATYSLTQDTDLHFLELGGDGIHNSAIVDMSTLVLDVGYWYVKIEIGAEQTCTVAHPAGTFVGIQSIDPDPMIGSYIVLHGDNVWDDIYWLEITPSTVFTYTSTGGGHGWLQASGTVYESYPDPVNPRGPKVWCGTLSYTYNYTYPVGGSSYECVLNKSPYIAEGQVVVDSGTGPDYDLVKEIHDCINVFNDIANDTTANYATEYKYKYGVPDPPTLATQLGGTGKYIEYEFVATEDLEIAERVTKTSIPIAPAPVEYDYIIRSTSPNMGYALPQNIIDYTGYQRDEIYRFALVCYDLKGRPSFAKWIADIRFPRTSEELYLGSAQVDFDFTIIDGTSPTDKMHVRPLGIKFTIDWAEINADYTDGVNVLTDYLSGFQIVRCPRTDGDCTVKAQGVVVPTHTPIVIGGSITNTSYSTYNITSAKDYEDDAVTTIPNITGTNSVLNKLLVELLSPEIAINKELMVDSSSDFLEAYGYLDNVRKGHVYMDVPKLKSRSLTAMTVTSYDTTQALIANHRKNIDDGFISRPEDRFATVHTIDGVQFTPRGYDDDTDGNDPEMTYKGTSLVANLSTIFENVTSAGIAGEEKAMYGRYRRYLGFSQYGGATYSERASNQYVQASEFLQIAVVPASYTVYGGDTYLTPFLFMKLFYDADAEYAQNPGENSGQCIVSFPVESRINLHYKLDNISKYYTIPVSDAAVDQTTYYLAEESSIGLTQQPDYYPDIQDLYRYNSAYSAEDSSRIFLLKPYDFRSSDIRDVMVASSELKFPGEYSDSWLKFKYNNYLELEGKYGPITRLINHNENMLAFQARGIAKLSILEREAVQTNNTQSLAIGTGGILSRYDYLTKKIGTQLYDAICQTDSSIYFYDNLTNSINRVLATLEPISDLKGMKSYFESTPYTSLITAYDKANREVLFTPITGDTINFSEYLDAFAPFFTLCPTSYITFDKYVISSLDNNVFYLHNVGNCNQFYGVYRESSITVIANPAKTKTMTFHEIEWITDLTTSGEDILNQTFDSLQVSNTYQDTGVMNLDTRPDITKRFRKWRINTFRNSGDDGRIRDSWVKAAFKWQQTHNNKKLVVHPITFKYTPTKV